MPEILVSKLSHHPLNQMICDISDIDDLGQSIQEVGLLHSLVVDGNNQIISGNRRFADIKELGWKKVTCENIKIDDGDVTEYIIHYNRQRVKTLRELLNEYRALEKIHRKCQGISADD
jgi:ParB family transcriptional regulator, chromosome partitioning protein